MISGRFDEEMGLDTAYFLDDDFHIVTQMKEGRSASAESQIALLELLYVKQKIWPCEKKSRTFRLFQRSASRSSYSKRRFAEVMWR